MNEINKINIGGCLIGIINLKATLEEMAKFKNELSETELKERLLQRLKAENYIPTKPEIENEYKEAFLREFKKYLGEPVEKEVITMKKIQVFGPGCPRCHALFENLQRAVAELEMEGELKKVTDIIAMAKKGILGSPALVVDGRVKSTGKVLSVEEVKRLLQKE